ncbi:hypothetical protein HDR58_07880 [bacterium]|nr:hypothetical protein [bacterium]
MGFMLGAFGKLNAGKYYRSLQSRMMKIQSNARRATRDVEKMTKMLDAQEKRALNSLSSMSSGMYMATQQSLMMSTGLGALQQQWAQNGGQLDEESMKAYNEKSSMVTQQLSQMKAMNEQMVSNQKQQIQDYFEYMRETQLEPLKDEEERLQTEKDSLESQIQLAKADYDACKQMEKTDAEMLKPQYTAG